MSCEALEATKEDGVFSAFRRRFTERGLPNAIRSDNSLPFASPNGLYNLSKLSVWWLMVGIAIERIRPGHPQQNGCHERMHLTLDDFVSEFNMEPPHEALVMKVPSDVSSVRRTS